MQAHIGNENPNYAQLFNRMTCLRGTHHNHGKHVLAVGQAALTENEAGSERLFLVLYSGDDDRNQIWYDLNERAEFNS
jgi:hypothetical protein